MNRLLAAANTARWKGYAVEGDEVAADAERRLEALFRISETLAVYGTLAPGQPNHHVVAPLGGEWTDGVIEGELLQVGWGATLGYPAFRPVSGGAAVAVKVLTASALASAWPELDDFEGDGYRRILVPVFHAGRADGRRLYTIANLYAAADAAPG
ncbi:MAG TPA: gamma-glutamylcyclotransferase [Longimicrobium sp.]|nr:gamma-glutamylcyclotransferase [Longimicrobium sp.]